MINNTRLLPQNKAPFGLDQLSKFRQFVQKCVPKICALSSQTEGTITTRRSRGNCLSQEPPSKLAREWRSATMSHDPRQARSPPQTTVFHGEPNWTQLLCCALVSQLWYVPVDDVPEA